jgi:hypothetical protein
VWSQDVLCSFEQSCFVLKPDHDCGRFTFCGCAKASLTELIGKRFGAAAIELMLHNERTEHVFGLVECAAVKPIRRKSPELGDRPAMLEFSQPEFVGDKHHFEMMQRRARLTRDFGLQSALMVEIGEDG